MHFKNKPSSSLYCCCVMRRCQCERAVVSDGRRTRREVGGGWPPPVPSASPPGLHCVHPGKAVPFFVPLSVGVRMAPGSLSLCTAQASQHPQVELMYPVFTRVPGESYLSHEHRLAPQHPQVEFIYLVFTRMPGESYLSHKHKLHNILRWSLCTLCLLLCQVRFTCHTNTAQTPQHPQVEFMYLVFTRVPGESYLSHKHNTSSTTSSGGVDVHCIYLHAR